MKLITLSARGKLRCTTKVDDEDYQFLMRWKWQKNGQGYACRRDRRNNMRIVFMHREIMRPDKNMMVDHIDHDPLNNQRSNLRVCTPHKNTINRVSPKNSASKYKGVCSYVSPNKKHQYWRALIKPNKEEKQIFLGYFKTEEDAARAYNEAARKYHGEYATLNKIPTV